MLRLLPLLAGMFLFCNLAQADQIFDDALEKAKAGDAQAQNLLG